MLAPYTFLPSLGLTDHRIRADLEARRQIPKTRKTYIYIYIYIYMLYILVYDCFVYISTFFGISRPPHPSRLGGHKTNPKDEKYI